MQGTGLIGCLSPACLLAGALPAGAGAEAQLGWSATDFDAARVLSHVASTVTDWASEGYRRNPAVMLGLLALLVLPVLAPIGLLLRKDFRAGPKQPVYVPGSLAPPVRALWIEIEGVSASRRRLGHRMVRIGRQDDNELRIDDASVHRYHAVIYPSPEDGVMIADVGGRHGNGIRVNGERVTQAPLKAGDRLSIGRVALRIGAAE